jgi:hypothetical protein
MIVFTDGDVVILSVPEGTDFKGMEALREAFLQSFPGLRDVHVVHAIGIAGVYRPPMWDVDTGEGL